MEIVFKICGIALLGVMMQALLRRNAPEMSAVSAVALVIVMSVVASGAISDVIEIIYEIAENAGISEDLLRPLLKCLGISIVTRIACDICKDGGAASAASYMELIGAVACVTIAAPLIFAVLHQIQL